MSSAARRSRLEALKAGQSSSDEEEEEFYEEQEDEYEDLDEFVVEAKDTGYKASAHQQQSTRNKANRGGNRLKPRPKGSQQSGSYAISRKRRTASNRTAAKPQPQSKQQKQSSMNTFFKKSATRNVSRKYNSNRTAAAKNKKGSKNKKSDADFMSDLLGKLDSDDDDDEALENQGDTHNGDAPHSAMAVDPEPAPHPESQPMTAVPVDAVHTVASDGANPTKRFRGDNATETLSASTTTTTTTAPPKGDKAAMSEDEDMDIASKRPPSAPAATDSAVTASSANDMFTLSAAEERPAPKVEDVGSTDDYPRGKPGFVDFFWFDAFEDAVRRPGELYLFGKTLNAQNRWDSVCVFVRNVERTMFVLPRLLNEADDVDVGERVDVMEVYNELNAKRQRLGITKMAACPIERRYCFRARRDGVPATAQYLKMCYSFKFKAFSGPQFDSGRTYSRIFGANSTALELFLLDKQMMGPCWLRVPRQRARRVVSWCATELELDEPDKLTVLSANFPSPHFKVLAVAFQTVLNERKEHEVAAISGVLQNAVCIDYANRSKQSPPSSTNIEYFTLVRKIGRNPIPFDLEKALKAKNYNVSASSFQSFATERELLNFWAAKLGTLDPDVLVGHSLYDFVLDVVLRRMQKKEVKHWSKVGRLRKGRFPFAKRGGSLQRRNLGSGRLLADTFLSAQEFLQQKTYTLSHLAPALLDGVESHDNLPIDRVPAWWTEGRSLAEVVLHVANDANLVLQLMHKLEVLPLTKELTNLCGNLWARSLVSQRAERNEWLLLHEFHRNGFIVPEQLTWDEKVAAGIVKDTRSGGRKRAKAQYAGGLVLEPEKGLYDKFVLCLDFNSLYPSIVQEFNLCFSTTEHWKFEKNKNTADADGEPKIDIAKMQESIAAETGVLPKVIGVLLTRRSSVKKLLKSAKGEADRKRLDVQQKALKLVANSMYGTLGFTMSRFYCEPIAALITALGRESLMKAAEIAESVASLRVIYGDTDSIFVFTDTDDLVEARRFALEIKKKVNRLYKKMYLDLDYVFSKILLLRKKKYAALKVVSFDTDCSGKAVNIRTTKEIKGLDVVRRDWSVISKEVGVEVLDAILTPGAQLDDIVVAIQELLQRHRKAMDDNEVELKRFCITKKLTKSPRDYPDPGKQPHVMVAMEMHRMGMKVDTGSFIEYIICRQRRDSAAADSLASRAYHIAEIEKSIKEHQDGGDEAKVLRVDSEWYLAQQILPPVGRYCEPIEGAPIGLLAHALGLDSAKYKHLQRGSNTAGGGGTAADEEDLEDKIMRITNPLQKYKDICGALKIRCRHCDCKYDFGGVFDFRTPDAKSGLLCPTPSCKGIVAANDRAEAAKDIVAIKNALSLQIWNFVQEYYGREWVCLDLSCSFRTRQLPLNGLKCPKLGCSSSMKESYSAAQLFDQLRYFAFLFDRAEQLKLLRVEQQSNTNFAGTQLTRHQEAAFDEIHQWIKSTILQRSKYYFIDSAVIFKYLM